MPKNQQMDKDPFVAFARAAIHAWITGRKTLLWEEYSDGMAMDTDFAARMAGASSGAFVSIHQQGSLRGCIGTIEPIQDSLAEEIAANAVSACSRDPRFPPVRAGELEGLEIHVLKAPVPYIGPVEWDVARFGVIVYGRRGRRGLLLPDLDGVETAADQMDIAMRKAGLASGEVEGIWLFEIERHS
jgi:uncharacterized protein (TIGR00296 family)